MNRASPLVFLGLGAAIATGALFLMSQAVPPTPNHSGSYGPPKKNVVNIFEMPTNPIVLTPGQELVIYTVPSDRWLTVTACDARAGIVQGWGLPKWGESYGGTFNPKGFADNGGLSIYGQTGQLPAISSPPGGDVGWVFRPGSQLVIRNPSTFSNAGVDGYAVIGYLSRE